MFRLTRHLYHRICPSGDVKTLYVLPIFKNETLGKINGQIRMISTPDVGATTTAISPFGCIEYSFSVFFVPWQLAASYTPASGSMPAIPTNVAGWDAFMRKLILTYSSTASSQFYDPDATKADEKLLLDPVAKDDTTPSNAVLIPKYPSLGPQGLIRISNTERMLSSMTKIDAAVNSASTSVYTGSVKINDMVYSDQIDVDQDIGISGPGFLVSCVTRHDTASAFGYASSYGTETGIDTDYYVGASDRIAVLNSLFNGDKLRIDSILKDRSTELANWLRTLLFMGDVSNQPVNSTQNPTLSALWTDGNVFRQNDISVTAKLMAEYSTPYAIIPDLM